MQARAAVALVFGLVAAFAADPALAGTTRLVEDSTRGGTGVSFTAADGEANMVDIAFWPGQAAWVVTDRGGSTTTAEPPCTPFNPPRGIGSKASCQSQAVSFVAADLGDGNDDVSLVATNYTRGFASGGPGDDRLFGTPVGDVLRGDDGRDRVEGSDGPDELTGGGGVDTLLGGDGGDLIEARDGMRDDVECGAGSDQVRADAVDAVAADCEDVERGGAPPPGLLPSAVTVIAADVGRTSATLVAVVNPRGSATAVAFEFGPTKLYGSRTDTRTLGSATGDAVVELAATGLAPGTTYHFRAVATSAEGTTLGRDLSFTTLATPSAPARVCVVPRLLGRSLKAARAALTRSRCRVGAVRRVRARAKRGTVVAQGSRAGRRLPLGARVNLTVSR